ncbi:MAG: hypothetical protein QM537_00625 [Candidatus Symbiobacter sp.]|nr:hypothetical protein [Candidatus Symbiobacter sp.]
MPEKALQSNQNILMVAWQKVKADRANGRGATQEQREVDLQKIMQYSVAPVAIPRTLPQRRFQRFTLVDPNIRLTIHSQSGK